MRSIVIIDQAKVAGMGLGLDLQDAAIFGCVSAMLEDGGYLEEDAQGCKNITARAVLDELPLLDLGEWAVRMRMQKLVDAGLLKKHIGGNSSDRRFYGRGKDYYKLAGESPAAGVQSGKDNDRRRIIEEAKQEIWGGILADMKKILESGIAGEAAAEAAGK